MNTSMWVIVAGLIVTAIGWMMMTNAIAAPDAFGAGVVGFGLAHIVLGGLDALRREPAGEVGGIEEVD